MTERGFLPPGPNEVEWLGAPVFRGPVAPIPTSSLSSLISVSVGFRGRTFGPRSVAYETFKLYLTDMLGRMWAGDTGVGGEKLTLSMKRKFGTGEETLVYSAWANVNQASWLVGQMGLGIASGPNQTCPPDLRYYNGTCVP